jgi:DNA-binding CsgD family transcriptional regulator/tetratricopeptide (TPR) repeat protein
MLLTTAEAPDLRRCATGLFDAHLSEQRCLLQDVGTVTDRDHLMERDAELASLSDGLARVRESGRGELMLVCGEAGIGKTALIREHCASHTGETRVLWGACEPLSTPSPLAPIAEIAVECGGGLKEALGRELRPFEVMEELARELARQPVTTLVVEDLHWADDATLDVLRLLGRRSEDVPALIVASYRDSELDRFHPLRRVLGDLAAAVRLGRIELAPLSLDAIRSVASAYGLDPDELSRTTGGNPFFLREVAERGDSGHVPANVRDAVLARASRVSSAGWRLLEAVAVFAGPVELPVLEAVVAQDAVASTEECMAAGILTARDGTIGFRHELARLVIEESVAPDRALALHRRALKALRGDSAAGCDARLAYHAEGARDADAVLGYAPAAAAQASSVGAHREAAAQWARALRFAGSTPPETRGDLCRRRSFECYVTTEDEEALAATEQAIAIYREAGDRVREADSLRWLALVHSNAGRVPQARRAADEALRLLEPLAPGRELAMVYGTLAVFSLIAEEFDETVGWGQKALDLATHLRDEDGRAAALGTLGAAEALRGLQGGTRKLQRALALAQSRQLENQVGRTYVLLGMAASRERSLARMQRWVEAGLTFCDERDLAVWGRILLAMQSWLQLEQGSWDAALRTVSLVLSMRCTLSTLQARIVLGLLRARRGLPDAWGPLFEAGVVADGTAQLWWRGQVAAARAEAAWLEGRPDEVVESTEDAYRQACESGSPWAVGELGLWRRRAGVTEDPATPLVAPFALHAAGDHVGASDWWRDAGCHYEAALALADAGDERTLRRSLAELHRLDAGPAAKIVARRLRRGGARHLPRGPRATTRANPGGLTRRETEILALLAEGLRNREIAGRLFLSPRTVDYHVAGILRKLGVRGRVQAVREAARLGML